MKILIVDDDPLSRKLLRLALLDLGFEVQESFNGLDATAILRNKSFQLVITDILMPEMDGIEFCKNLRSEPKYSHIKIIAITSGAYTIAQDVALRSVEFYVDATLKKPFKKNELYDALVKANCLHK